MGKLKFWLPLLIIFGSIGTLKSQGVTDQWGIGGGFSYPRLVGTDQFGSEFDYGGFLTVQRQVSEHVTFKINPFYRHFSMKKVKTTTDLFGASFNLQYTFLPFSKVQPYFAAGFGGAYQMVKAPVSKGGVDENTLDYQAELKFGVIFDRLLSNNLSLTMELSYLTLANDMLDGLEGPLGGLLGGTRDAYMAFDIGLLYNFSRGPVSKLSEIYGGVTPGTTDAKSSSVSLVQAYPGKPLFQNAWKLGAGFIYPRFAGTEAVGKEFNYGGYLSLERAFTEHMSGRMKPFYINVAEKGNNAPTNSVIGVGFDFLYKFVPCEPVVPYIGLGASSFYATVTNARSFKDESFLDYQINVLLGADWRFGEKFNVVTELGYYTVATDKFDGIYGSIGGLFGGAADSYMGFSVGINYILSNGPKSELCNLYSGIGIVKYIEKDPNTTDPGKTDPSQQGTTYEPIDYAKIEEIVKKYRQDPVDYEKIRQMIKENAGPGTSWILSGVNFDFASANLRPESYPILNNAAQVLMSNPSMRVEIQGHTDNVGTDATNRTLSQNRADAVKSYLVGRGIESNRMTTLGLGFSVPIASNATAEGRAMNRRVEFKVISK